MPQSKATAANAADSEELRLLRTYFDLNEKAREAEAARGQVRDRLLILRAEGAGFAAGHASAARTSQTGEAV